MSEVRELSPFERAFAEAIMSAMPPSASGLTQVTREGNCVQLTFRGVTNEEQVLDAAADALVAMRAQFADDPFEVDLKIRRGM